MMNIKNILFSLLIISTNCTTSTTIARDLSKTEAVVLKKIITHSRATGITLGGAAGFFIAATSQKEIDLATLCVGTLFGAVAGGICGEVMGSAIAVGVAKELCENNQEESDVQSQRNKKLS